MNLAARARTATGLSMRAFAKLLGTDHSHVSRWEKGTMSWSSTAEALFVVIERLPAEAVQALAEHRGAPGFAGDGGPPPVRARRRGPIVDEHGFLAEPELGFDGELDVADEGFDEDDPHAVPDFKPEFGPFDG